MTARDAPAASDPRTSLALYYAAHFGHLGIVLPYLPLWLLATGHDGASIGLIVALSPLSKLLAPWTWGRLADRTGRRRALLVGASVAGATALVVVTRLSGLLPLAAGVLVYALCVAPGVPFAEATALEQAAKRGFAYGRVRLWGSVSFVVAAATAGAALGPRPGSGMLLAAAGLLLLAAASAARLPPPRADRDPAARPSDLRRSLRDPSLWRLLVACALMQASHGPYYAFYSIRLETLGYGGAAIGALWAFAVMCEVLLLSRVDAGIDRLRTTNVLRASLLAACLRWLTIAVAVSPGVLAAAQALHALTYAAFHVAALREIQRAFGAEDRTTGLVLYSGLSFGAGIFGGTLAAGFLAEAVGLSGLFGIAAALPLAALLVLGSRGGGALPRVADHSVR